jgi:hypothetical protein
MRYDCGGFSLELPRDWLDTTESDASPFTLSKAAGVGALQFSLALYVDGEAPSPDSQALFALLVDFAKTNSLGQAKEVALEDLDIILAAASFLPDGDTFVRAWYLSDGFSFAKVTYLCNKSHLSSELSESEQIVRSIRFASKGT